MELLHHDLQLLKGQGALTDGWSKMDCRRAEDLLDTGIIYGFSKRDETRGTARFLHFLKQFKDTTYSVTPVRRIDDSRLALMHDLYEWTSAWRASTALEYKAKKAARVPGVPALTRQGLPRQTIEGMHRTLSGIIQITEFVLTTFPDSFVCFKRFRQNVVEHHFSHVRSLCGGGRNPTVAQYGAASARAHTRKGVKRILTKQGIRTNPFDRHLKKGSYPETQTVHDESGSLLQ